VHARLSAYYYCPSQVDELVYMATVQNYRRVLEAPSEEERLTFALVASFLDYVLLDAQGTCDRRKGMRLGEPGIELLARVSGEGSRIGPARRLKAVSLLRRESNTVEMITRGHVIMNSGEKGGGLVAEQGNASLEVEGAGGGGERAVTEPGREARENFQRKSATRPWSVLRGSRPCLEEGVSLAEMARTHQTSLKNVQRWVWQYRREGLVGLARRRRSDRGKRRGIPLECVHLIARTGRRRVPSVQGQTFIAKCLP
jgi:hypothetical protein